MPSWVSTTIPRCLNVAVARAHLSPTMSVPGRRWQAASGGTSMGPPACSVPSERNQRGMAQCPLRRPAPEAAYMLSAWGHITPTPAVKDGRGPSTGSQGGADRPSRSARMPPPEGGGLSCRRYLAQRNGCMHTGMYLYVADQPLRAAPGRAGGRAGGGGRARGRGHVVAWRGPRATAGTPACLEVHRPVSYSGSPTAGSPGRAA